MEELLAIEQIGKPFAIYLSVLFSSCLLCTIVFLFKKRRRLLSPSSLTGWNITWVDFGILIWLLFIWILLASRLSNLFHIENIEHSESWATILNSVGMQLGMLMLFLAFRMFKSGYEAPRLNQDQKDFGECILKGLYCMLLTYPLVTLVNLIWAGILKVLNTLGLNIPIEKQLVVEYFQNAPSTTIFIALASIAVIVAPIAEEFIFRGGIFRFFKSKMGLHAAALLSASLFATLHFSILGFPALLLLGYLLAIIYERSRNIWVGVCLHGFFNFNSVLLILLQPNL